MGDQTGDNEIHLLVEAARDGDEAAFRRLVDQHKEGVFATIVSVTRDFDVAHDIAQEVFLRAWFGLARLEELASFGGWLRTIARNRARTWLERQQRQPVQESMDMDQLTHGGHRPDEVAERSERRRLVLAALDQLPPGSREVLLLHYMEGLTTPRMATQLGITEPAVRQRLRRARLHLQEEMEAMIADVVGTESPGSDFSDEVAALLAQTRAFFGSAQYRAAAPALEAARERAPDDTLVSLLLADAYCFARTPDELGADRGAWDRALALYDEVLEREPGNLLVQLRRAALRSVFAPEAEVLAEQQRLREEARGGPYEAVAQLELARRHAARGQAAEALRIYAEMEGAYPWMACILHSEMGVAHAVTGDGGRALEHFERAVALTTPEAMARLEAVSRELLGDTYWAFWSAVDSLPVRQCQNHAWLAGLRARSGHMKAARQHVREAIAHLEDDAIGPARTVLRREFVRRVEEMFPELASEPEVRQLKRQIEADG